MGMSARVVPEVLRGALRRSVAKNAGGKGLPMALMYGLLDLVADPFIILPIAMGSPVNGSGESGPAVGLRLRES